MYICVCVCVHLVAHLPCILHTAAPLLVLRLLHWHATERVCVRCCATKARSLAPAHPHPPNANVNSLALLPRIFTFSCKILNRNKFSWNKFLPIRHFKTCGCCFCCHGSTIITNTKWDLDWKCCNTVLLLILCYSSRCNCCYYACCSYCCSCM